MRVLTEDEVRALVGPRLALAVTKEALVAQAAGAVSQPDPWHLELPEVRGEVHIKGAHLHGATHFAAKLATGFYANAAKGLPVSSGLSVIADAETGFPEVIALDNGYLTELRTGAAGAAATEALSRPDAAVVAVIGPGAQARYQLRALLEVRDPVELRLYGRDPERAAAFAEEMRALHGWKVVLAPSAEAAVREADVVHTVTPSREPVISGAWLSPGAHVTAVGADMAGKRELDAAVLERADVVAADDVRQCRAIGELQYAPRRPAVALGDVIAGRAPGRTSPGQITVADLTGLGAEDAAIGTALARAL
ncbi:hypothetical protein [Nonomuraea jiangxiensis]|uniref:Ornithine cyclodeaminase n=1 Tax=Nonomuraea jiangxiensis TaxID=633440 RepID=A0A1G9JTM5_9ACTN|nr:hypothetical protein [Nonomuraea jiangxiensis]SDL40990.1 ornithine cyclodeaminase [Nonomuraea jiangxiensis]